MQATGITRYALSFNIYRFFNGHLVHNAILKVSKNDIKFNGNKTIHMDILHCARININNKRAYTNKRIAMLTGSQATLSDVCTSLGMPSEAGQAGQTTK
ncbi:unnamed protein product [Callosobruchus maculatus]|uniref:Uncharacterized protein n=1 Tax=Callosobruchus maculatus TaxID=64391 RepID=A0A653CYP6_CALMS|nr:unnamed protein product [Callosobruchus maculatus]